MKTAAAPLPWPPPPAANGTRPPPPHAAVSRESLSDLFLRVSAQLDALQPPTKSHATASAEHPDDQEDLEEQPLFLLPSRERIHEIVRSNQKFRPAEDVHRRRTGPTTSSSKTATATTVANPGKAKSPSSRETTRRESVDAAAVVATGDISATGQAAHLFMPVGGRARVFQWSDLARAKRSMKKRSLLLTNNLQASTAAKTPLAGNSDAWDLAQTSALASSGVSGKQALIAELVHRTEFTTQHIFHMSRKFKEIAGHNKSVISFAEFRQILSDDVAALLDAIGVSSSSAPSGGSTLADTGASQEPTAADMRMISATISTSESFLRRLFQMFDGDGDGKIDFKEFVVGLNGFVKGSIDDKVDALFEIYETTSDELLTPSNGHTPEQQLPREPTVAISDLLGLFQGDRQLYQELMRCVDEYFARVELPSGLGEDEEVTTIAMDNFVAASLAEPSLLETITRPTSSLMFSEDAVLRQRLKAFVGRSGLHWRKMVTLQRRVLDWGTNTTATTSLLTSAVAATTSGSSSVPMSDLRMPVATFLQILTETVIATCGRGSGGDGDGDGDDLDLLLRCYISKASASASVSGATSPPPLLNVPAFLQDLTVVLLHPTALSSSDVAVDAEAKARYYFELYDLNRDGLLSRSELMSAVCAGFAHFGPHLTEVVRVLEDEDADQDGQVTKAQYLRAARRSSIILASLYTCL